MGVGVYEARQEGLNRIVALKMILNGEYAGAEELARFRAEALAIAKLHHPNIVQVYAVGTHEGLPFFALEFCPGGTLAGQFASGRPMAPPAAAALIATVARAVHAAHQAGIVHRDLKPGNILLAADGAPKVADFGLAKQLDAPTAKTQTGVVMGTPSYMSPEQATGQTQRVGPAADVYALGAILYEALTGRPPFAAATTWETLQLVCTREPPPPRQLRADLPADLEAIVLQCLDKHPHGRYAASAAELADDLERWLRGESVRAHRRSAIYRLKKQLHRHRKKTIATAAALLLLPVLWIGLADAGVAVPGSGLAQRWLDRHATSLFRPIPSEHSLRAAAAEHRQTLRLHLLGLAQQRDGWFARPGDEPDAWTQMQGTVAILSDPEMDRKQLTHFALTAERMFEPDPACGSFVPGFGFDHYPDGNISGESVAWTLFGLAKILAQPDLLTAEERERLLARLEQVQTTLDRYRSHDKKNVQPNGGWNLYAQQEDPARANLYITLMMCHALLQMQQADLGWHQSAETRDRLLDTSIAWLLRQFDGRGWSTPSTVAEQFNDGFTLQVFTALLQAEAVGRVELPDQVRDAIPRLLAECSTKALEHKSPVALFTVAFRNQQGKAVTFPSPRMMRPAWHGWAVGCASLWLRRCERTGAAHDEVVRTRRVLGHLLLTLGPAVIEESTKGYTYVSAEELIGLAALAPP